MLMAILRKVFSEANVRQMRWPIILVVTWWVLLLNFKDLLKRKRSWKLRALTLDAFDAVGLKLCIDQTF